MQPSAPELADIYKTRLDLAGYQCIIAGDGANGVSIIKQKQPDLVLLDLMLPQLSGDEVLKNNALARLG